MSMNAQSGAGHNPNKLFVSSTPSRQLGDTHCSYHSTSHTELHTYDAPPLGTSNNDHCSRLSAMEYGLLLMFSSSQCYDIQIGNLYISS